jgi:hypothetical protein
MAYFWFTRSSPLISASLPDFLLLSFCRVLFRFALKQSRSVAAIRFTTFAQPFRRRLRIDYGAVVKRF